MKKSVLFFVYILCNYSYSFSQGSTLSIVSENESFVLFLNNVNVSPMPNTVAVVDGMKVGRNHVRLAFSRKGVPELNAQIELSSDGKIHQLAYKVGKDSKGKYVLQFVGDNTMSIVGQDTDDTQSDDISGSTNATTKESSSDNKVSANASVSGAAKTQEVKVTINQSTVSMNMTIPAEEGSKSADKTDKNNNNRVPAVSDGLMCASPSVDAQTLLKFKYKLSSVNMEMYKAKDIKEFMNKHCMLSAQVADLVKIVQMNDYQYEVAQLGYLRTYDQANYGLVVEALMADFNKEKLLNFISTNQTSVSSAQTSERYEPIKEDRKSEVEPKQSNSYPTTTTNNFSYACMPMEANDFDEALEAVDDPIDEDNKLEVAKSVFDKECLSTNQVYKVVDLFIDEERKLDFAKFAFSRTSDKDKYFRINKAFIDESRITELSNYVKNNR